MDSIIKQAINDSINDDCIRVIHARYESPEWHELINKLAKLDDEYRTYADNDIRLDRHVVIVQEFSGYDENDNEWRVHVWGTRTRQLAEHSLDQTVYFVNRRTREIEGRSIGEVMSDRTAWNYDGPRLIYDGEEVGTFGSENDARAVYENRVYDEYIKSTEEEPYYEDREAAEDYLRESAPAQRA